MKYILAVFVICLISCSKDEPTCKACFTVVKDDLNKQLGLANNGFDEKSRVSLGEQCGDALKTSQSIGTETATGNFNGTTYTIQTSVICE